MHENARVALGQQAAIDAVKAEITVRWVNATLLSDETLRERFPGRPLICGWSLTSADTRCQSDLILALPDMFPNALPIVALSVAPPPATLPHVEIDGVICITAGGALMELPAGFRHVEFVVTEALELIKAGQVGSNRDEFLDEVGTYWALKQPNSIDLWYLPGALVGTHRLQAMFLGGAAVVVGESREAVAEWIKHIKPLASKNQVIDAAFAQLPGPLYPDSYPSDTFELLSLVATAGQDALDLVGNTLVPGKQTPLLLSFEHKGQQQLLGVHVETGMYIGDGRGKLPLWHGFRKGHVPKDELLNRIAAARYPVVRATALRVDSDFLLRRTTGEAAASLANMRVAVIGCGALGGQVIQMLAQAGVKHLMLVDNDLLTWQNIGRHVLTSRYIGQNKSSAMRQDLLSRFADYDVTAVESKWQDAWKSSPDIFDKCDLIISLTADWLSDSLLNTLSKEGGEVPPVIFGWLEAHGLAGHAVVVLPEGGCLRCLTNSLGEYQHHVAVVPEHNAIQRESSCGSFYQPFSAASSAPLASQIVGATVRALSGRTNSSEHRVWVGVKDDFDVIGATVSPQWHEVLLTQGYERVLSTSLPRGSECPICRKSS